MLPGANNDLGRPLFASPLNEAMPLGGEPPLGLDAEGRVTLGAVVNWYDDYGRVGAPEVTVRRGVRFTAARPLRGRTFSATIVGDDHVPVSLDDGLDTCLYVFVAPRDVAFDRPLPIKLPNLDHLAPGAPLMIMRYDAEAGRWAREAGSAHVGADGAAVVSDEGSGLRGGGWYAFVGERTYSEYTRVNYMQVEGNPQYEGMAFINLEVYSGAKSALMMSGWGEGEYKRLHFRVTRVALDDDIVLDSEGMQPSGDTSKEVEVTVTPSAHAMYQGRMVILSAVGRPHPGGYYVWTSSDPSVASVEPFVGHGGSDHPNLARVFAHRQGRARVTALYVTHTGATSAAYAEIICVPPKAP